MEKYILAFLKCKGVGNVKLLNYFKKYKMNIIDILKNKNEIINNDDIQLFENYVNLSENEIKSSGGAGISIISLFDNRYPIKLLNIKDPVLYLYYKGNINLINNTSIAIIGSRDIDDKSQEIITMVSKYVSSKGVTVVSGLALGSDTYAHLGSYNEVGTTIAVLPSGLDVITPSSNKKLANDILNNNGLIVSEYFMGTVPTKYTFVKRDRIQAALADSVIVVKANENSGTMHAVKIAQEQDKYVSQYKENKNSLIFNNFSNSEDIDEIINKAKSIKYEDTNKHLIEQVSLF